MNERRVTCSVSTRLQRDAGDPAARGRVLDEDRQPALSGVLRGLLRRVEQARACLVRVARGPYGGDCLKGGESRGQHPAGRDELPELAAR